MRLVFKTLMFGLAIPAVALAQSPSDGGLRIYRQHCATCHEGGVSQTLSPQLLRERTADQIYAALNTGLMRRQDLELSDAERRTVAAYLSGGDVSGPPLEQIPQTAYCAAADSVTDPLSAPQWNGWGVI